MCVPNNYNILVSYRIGGGKVGNVGARTINTFITSEINGVANFYNEDTAYQLGEDLESIETARAHAPARYRTLNRAITKMDFEDITREVEGVAKCKVIESFNIDREVYIYVAPVGYGELTEELKSEILQRINDVKLVHDKPVIKEPKYIDFDINVEAVIGANFVNKEVKTYIEKVLAEKFSVDYNDFGQTVYTTDIYRYLLQEVGQIRSLTIKAPLEDFTAEADSIPRVRTITVKVTGGVDIDGL